MLTEEIIDLIVKKRLGTLNSQEEIKLEQWIQDDNAEEFIDAVNTLKTALELYDTYKYYNADSFKEKQKASRLKQTAKEKRAQRISTEGTHSEGISTEGTHSEGTHSEGISTEGTHSEGTHSEGISTEGINYFKRINFRKVLKYAAIIAFPLLLGAGYLFVYDNPYFQKPIPPGKEIAVLDLPNGESVKLSSNIAKIKKSNGREIIIPKIDVIDYLALSQNFEEANYTTIKVPQGGFYYVMLSDGTVVWLNSNSRMRFPLKFFGKERKVWLEGEAFFDVSKDSIPFIVSTDCQDIRVLGTSFNVSAYPEDATITTALISGTIVLQGINSQESVVLQAGDCAELNRSSLNVNLFEDDVQLYSLWKMGIFKFRERRLEDIVTVLKRWYNFDVEYQSESIKNLKFTAIALKNNPLDEVFRLLQMTTFINYKRRGNTVFLSD